jgi:general secretion pathway protein F
MPRFHYTAKKGPHDVVEGVLEAENRGGVLAVLAQQGFVPVRIEEQAAVPEAPAATPARPAVPGHPGRVPAGHLTIFTRQFASLARSHVPLLRALHILRDQARHPRMKSLLHDVAEDVRQGQTLSAALGKFPLSFPLLYVNLVRSGESSGTLDAVLERLAEQLERDEMLRARVRAALTYPCFVAVVGAGTVVFLLTFVMPRLSRILEGLGQRLPLATRALLAVADVCSSAWFWGGAAVVVAAALLLWRQAGERGRWLADRLLLRLPLAGVLVREVEAARFARTFGLQLAHGIPILQAMDVAVPIVSHRVIREQLLRLPEQVRQGRPLSEALQELPDLASPLLVNTVAVGEEGGRVGEALMEVADYYERDAERQLQTMATLLEPALIIAVGLVVSFIVMAVLLPIFEMSAINP